MLLAVMLQNAGSALVTDPTWVFLLVLAMILLAPLLLRRLRVPHIIGLIIAGILVGQHGFNILERDSSFELFGNVGIYYIMFLAGLELNMGSVRQYGWQGLAFGLLTFLLPFGVGMLTGHFVLGLGTAASLLLSCILASHTLVAYPIVGRYGLGRHRTAVISVVATAFAIFAALLTLALVVGSMDGDSNPTKWIFFALKCAVYGFIVAYIFPRVGRWFLRRYEESVAQYIFILVMVFLSAALAELAGLEGLLGAFLAGLALNRLIPHTSPLMSRVEFVGNALFIPYFLIGVGMIIDLRILLSDSGTIRVILALVLAATLSKWLASWLMARLARMGGESMWLMFGLTNAHAAGALAIVMVGTKPEVNLIDPSLLSGTVMLILFSCIISGFATSYGARQLALSDTSLEDNRGSYHGKCLVTYSQADAVNMMTQLAILIRNPYIPDSLMGLAVTYDGEEGNEKHRMAQQMLEQAKTIAAAADVQMATLSRMSSNISNGILHTLREYDAGEVIFCLTDRETGLPKTALGNTIEAVLATTHREVMAVRAIVPPGTLRQVQVAVPAKAEYEVGFYKWLEHLCRIGEQTDCRMEFRAHPDTMKYIQGYMGQKHPHVRATFTPMTRWGDLSKLYGKLGEDQMLVLVSARPGFISHTSALDNLTQMVHQHFADTSVMLLFPDQWGDPLESVSVFSPNGMAVTRQQNSLFGWLRRRFFAAGCLLLAALLPLQAQRVDLSKMSPLVRRAALSASPTRAAIEDESEPAVCALVRTTRAGVLPEHGCRSLASWGDIHIARIPLSRLAALSKRPEVLRIEAREPCRAQLDTALIITRAAALHQPADDRLPLMGENVVMGVMDIGFDLTHPTFRMADTGRLRISAFWDQLDSLRMGADTLFVGRQFTSPENILAKAHATDGYSQFHGTHTAGIACGSGHDGNFAGVAPKADICLVANAVSEDLPLIPEERRFLYTSATDLLGFKFIFDYAERCGRPCVISFSEGAYQDLYGDDQLAYEVLDSMVGSGRIICAAAGNLGRYLTYLHKPAGQTSARSLLQFESQKAYYTLRSSDKTQVRLSFLTAPEHVLAERVVTTAEILACPDSLLRDTVQFDEKAYALTMAAYPTCYDSTRWATELLLESLAGEENRTYRVLLTLEGREQEVEAFASGGHFANSSLFPDYQQAQFSHSIHTPGSAPSVICVGSTAYRTGVRNFEGQWQPLDAGSGGLRTTTSSVGPTLTGLVKPDVMAPGQNVISAMSSYYLEKNKESWAASYDVERFFYEGREYSWNAQSGTSMSCPLAAGIIALWLQACPTLSPQQAMEAIAATSRQPEAALSYPNTQYGYGEIDAEAGLRYILRHFAGIENPTTGGTKKVTAIFDLCGRQISENHVRHGIYVLQFSDGSTKKIKF